MTEERKLSAKERLAQKAKKEVKTPSAQKARDIIDISDKTLAGAIDRMCAAIHAKKAIDGHADAAKKVVLPALKERVFRDWVDHGSRTENPKVTTPSGSSFVLQVKDTLSGARGFKLPRDEQGDPVQLNDFLKENGCSDKLIEQVKGEFVTEDVNDFTDMAKLEKANSGLYGRLMDLVLAANEGGVQTKDGQQITISDEELQALLVRSVNVKVKEGFLDRSIAHAKSVATDAEDSVVALTQLLTAVSPQWAIGQATCLQPDKMIARLLHEEPPPETPSNAPPKDYDTPDGKHVLRVEGMNVTILRKNDMKALATKACKDNLHVKNTVTKWQREPASLMAFVGEYASSNTD